MRQHSLYEGNGVPGLSPCAVDHLVVGVDLRAPRRAGRPAFFAGPIRSVEVLGLDRDESGGVVAGRGRPLRCRRPFLGAQRVDPWHAPWPPQPAAGRRGRCFTAWRRPVVTEVDDTVRGGVLVPEISSSPKGPGGYLGATLAPPPYLGFTTVGGARGHPSVLSRRSDGTCLVPTSAGGVGRGVPREACQLGGGPDRHSGDVPRRCQSRTARAASDVGRRSRGSSGVRRPIRDRERRVASRVGAAAVRVVVPGVGKWARDEGQGIRGPDSQARRTSHRVAGRHSPRPWSSLIARCRLSAEPSVPARRVAVAVVARRVTASESWERRRCEPLGGRLDGHASVGMADGELPVVGVEV